MFNYLDKDRDSYLTYNDFCELCEEKRRQIDPFDSIVDKVREKQRIQTLTSNNEDMEVYNDDKDVSIVSNFN